MMQNVFAHHGAELENGLEKEAINCRIQVDSSLFDATTRYSFAIYHLL
jgi:hypothetical protein